VTFNEVVTGFTESDIAVTNGSVLTGTLVNAGNNTFTFSVTPAAQGNVVVTIPANAAQDVGGNGNTAGAFSRNYDITAPDAPVILGLTAASDTGTSSTDGITSDPTPTVSGAGEVGATVNVSIDGTAAGTATVPAGGAWTFTPLSALAPGNHTVTATQTVTSTASDPTNTTPIPFAVNFGEIVAGFEASDVTVQNGSVDGASFQDTGNGTFTFTVTPVAGISVTVSVSVAAGGVTAITDVAGNFSVASNVESRTYEDPGA